MATIYKLVAQRFPTLRFKLAQARIDETPEHYIQRTIFISALLAVAVTLILFSFTKSGWFLLAFPIIYVASFFYLFHYTDARIGKIQRNVSKEVVFAGRFLIIELESGVPMYTAFQNIAHNYEYVGKYFTEVLRRVDLGTPMEEAINEAVQLAPSDDLRRIFWQILNSLKTGSEISSALGSVIDQIVREQDIMVKEYGRKLNPMAMFYMMIAIIVPSLGTIMLLVLGTFISIRIGPLLLSLIIGLNVIVQLFFLVTIKSQRPPVEL
jgi:pilus assembly protein TadC